MRMKLKSLLRSTRGAITLDGVPGIMLTLVFIVTIAVAIYLVLAGLKTTASTVTGEAVTNTTLAAVMNMTTTMNNITSFAPTWGTVLGVAVLIGIVITAFAFGRKYV